MIYKPNVLRFWVKLQCESHLCDCSWPDMDDPYRLSSWFNNGNIPGSTRVQPTPFVESLHDNFVQVACLLSEVATIMQVYMDEKKKKLPLEGEHNEWNDSHLNNI